MASTTTATANGMLLTPADVRLWEDAIHTAQDTKDLAAAFRLFQSIRSDSIGLQLNLALTANRMDLHSHTIEIISRALTALRASTSTSPTATSGTATAAAAATSISTTATTTKSDDATPIAADSSSLGRTSASTTVVDPWVIALCRFIRGVAHINWGEETLARQDFVAALDLIRPSSYVDYSVLGFNYTLYQFELRFNIALCLWRMGLVDDSALELADARQYAVTPSHIEAFDDILRSGFDPPGEFSVPPHILFLPDEELVGPIASTNTLTRQHHSLARPESFTAQSTYDDNDDDVSLLLDDIRSAFAKRSSSLRDSYASSSIIDDPSSSVAVRRPSIRVSYASSIMDEASPPSQPQSHPQLKPAPVAPIRRQSIKKPDTSSSSQQQQQHIPSSSSPSPPPPLQISPSSPSQHPALKSAVRKSSSESPSNSPLTSLSRHEAVDQQLLEEDSDRNYYFRPRDSNVPPVPPIPTHILEKVRTRQNSNSTSPLGNNSFSASSTPSPPMMPSSLSEMPSAETSNDDMERELAEAVAAAAAYRDSWYYEPNTSSSSITNPSTDGAVSRRSSFSAAPSQLYNLAAIALGEDVAATARDSVVIARRSRTIGARAGLGFLERRSRLMRSNTTAMSALSTQGGGGTPEPMLFGDDTGSEIHDDELMRFSVIGDPLTSEEIAAAIAMEPPAPSSAGTNIGEISLLPLHPPPPTTPSQQQTPVSPMMPSTPLTPLAPESPGGSLPGGRHRPVPQLPPGVVARSASVNTTTSTTDSGSLVVFPTRTISTTTTTTAADIAVASPLSSGVSTPHPVSPAATSSSSASSSTTVVGDPMSAIIKPALVALGVSYGGSGSLPNGQKRGAPANVAASKTAATTETTEQVLVGRGRSVTMDSTTAATTTTTTTTNVGGGGGAGSVAVLATLNALRVDGQRPRAFTVESEYAPRPSAAAAQMLYHQLPVTKAALLAGTTVSTSGSISITARKSSLGGNLPPPHPKWITSLAGTGGGDGGATSVSSAGTTPIASPSSPLASVAPLTAAAATSSALSSSSSSASTTSSTSGRENRTPSPPLTNISSPSVATATTPTTTTTPVSSLLTKTSSGVSTLSSVSNSVAKSSPPPTTENTVTNTTSTATTTATTTTTTPPAPRAPTRVASVRPVRRDSLLTSRSRDSVSNLLQILDSLGSKQNQFLAYADYLVALEEALEKDLGDKPKHQSYFTFDSDSDDGVDDGVGVSRTPGGSASRRSSEGKKSGHSRRRSSDGTSDGNKSLSRKDSVRSAQVTDDTRGFRYLSYADSDATSLPSVTSDGDVGNLDDDVNESADESFFYALTSPGSNGRESFSDTLGELINGFTGGGSRLLSDDGTIPRGGGVVSMDLHSPRPGQLYQYADSEADSESVMSAPNDEPSPMVAAYRARHRPRTLDSFYSDVLKTQSVLGGASTAAGGARNGETDFEGSETGYDGGNGRTVTDVTSFDAAEGILWTARGGAAGLVGGENTREPGASSSSSSSSSSWGAVPLKISTGVSNLSSSAGNVVSPVSATTGKATPKIYVGVGGPNAWGSSSSSSIAPDIVSPTGRPAVGLQRARPVGVLSPPSSPVVAAVKGKEKYLASKIPQRILNFIVSHTAIAEADKSAGPSSSRDDQGPSLSKSPFSPSPASASSASKPTKQDYSFPSTDPLQTLSLPDIESFLYVRLSPATSTSYHLRWCILRDRTLYILRSPKDLRLLACLPLSSVDAAGGPNLKVEILPDADVARNLLHPHGFKIVSESPTMQIPVVHIATEHQLTMINWVGHLARAVKGEKRAGPRTLVPVVKKDGQGDSNLGTATMAEQQQLLSQPSVMAAPSPLDYYLT